MLEHFNILNYTSEPNELTIKRDISINEFYKKPEQLNLIFKRQNTTKTNINL